MMNVFSLVLAASPRQPEVRGQPAEWNPLLFYCYYANEKKHTRNSRCIAGGGEEGKD